MLYGGVTLKTSIKIFLRKLFLRSCDIELFNGKPLQLKIFIGMIWNEASENKSIQKELLLKDTSMQKTIDMTSHFHFLLQDGVSI